MLARSRFHQCHPLGQAPRSARPTWTYIWGGIGWERTDLVRVTLLFRARCTISRASDVHGLSCGKRPQRRGDGRRDSLDRFCHNSFESGCGFVTVLLSLDYNTTFSLTTLPLPSTAQDLTVVFRFSGHSSITAVPLLSSEFGRIASACPDTHHRCHRTPSARLIPLPRQYAAELQCHGESAF